MELKVQITLDTEDIYQDDYGNCNDNVQDDSDIVYLALKNSNFSYDFEVNSKGLNTIK